MLEQAGADINRTYDKQYSSEQGLNALSGGLREAIDRSRINLNNDVSTLKNIGNNTVSDLAMGY